MLSYPPSSKLRAMQIAYASLEDPHSLRSWSGTVYTLGSALEGSGAKLHRIGPLVAPGSLGWRIIRRGMRLVSDKRFHFDFEPWALRAYAAQVRRALRDMQVDALLSPGIIPIAELDIDIPIFTYADATFAAISGIHGDYRNVLERTRRFANRAEILAVKRTAHQFFASDWAAASAVEAYGADPAKVSVVPLGANFSGHFAPPSDDEISEAIEGREEGLCRLLFVGVRWRGKGGPKAVEIAEAMNARGIRTELHVVGSEPDGPVPPFVIRHGFLRKSSAEEAARLRQLYLTSHFFVLPTTDECFGIVFAEASAFGVPSLATDVGGVPTAVRDGRNGFVFSLNASAEEYVSRVARLLADHQQYRHAALAARQEFHDRLNWTQAGARIMGVIRKTVG